MSMVFDYFYGTEAEQFTFFRIPKVLFTDKRFKDMSTDAKLLYGLMLDRMGLSVKNKWLDDECRVYIVYTVDDIISDLGCARQKTAKLLDELETNVGLCAERSSIIRKLKAYKQQQNEQQYRKPKQKELDDELEL